MHWRITRLSSLFSIDEIWLLVLWIMRYIYLIGAIQVRR
jgi:hypothetical protein